MAGACVTAAWGPWAHADIAMLVAFLVVALGGRGGRLPEGCGPEVPIPPAREPFALACGARAGGCGAAEGGHSVWRQVAQGAGARGAGSAHPPGPGGARAQVRSLSSGVMPHVCPSGVGLGVCMRKPGVIGGWGLARGWLVELRRLLLRASAAATRLLPSDRVRWSVVRCRVCLFRR